MTVTFLAAKKDACTITVTFFTKKVEGSCFVHFFFLPYCITGNSLQVPQDLENAKALLVLSLSDNEISVIPNTVSLILLFLVRVPLFIVF